jgi:hypothetical protein
MHVKRKIREILPMLNFIGIMLIVISRLPNEKKINLHVEKCWFSSIFSSLLLLLSISR